MADYPDWVLRHKKKGTYINIQNGKYYLYAAHSERVPGTGKVRRVSDGYLGRITEGDGLIPPRRKLGMPVRVFEYGLSDTILSLCAGARTALGREFRANADFVMAGGALQFMFGEVMHEHYEASWLAVRLPGLDMRKPPTEKQRAGTRRIRGVIADAFVERFGEDCQLAASLLPLVKAVRMGGETVLAVMPDGARSFAERHGLRFEGVQDG